MDAALGATYVDELGRIFTLFHEKVSGQSTKNVHTTSVDHRYFWDRLNKRPTHEYTPIGCSADVVPPWPILYPAHAGPIFGGPAAEGGLPQKIARTAGPFFYGVACGNTPHRRQRATGPERETQRQCYGAFIAFYRPLPIDSLDGSEWGNNSNYFQIG